MKKWTLVVLLLFGVVVLMSCEKDDDPVILCGCLPNEEASIELN
jgi:hypothetical protein